jgi:hypothetical protein
MTGVRMSNLCARIEDIMIFRLWNRGIGSVSAMVYFQQSDSQKLTVQEMQCKGFDIPDVIGDTR